MGSRFFRKALLTFMTAVMFITYLPAKEAKAEEIVLETDKTVYQYGDPIMVSYSGTSNKDWIGLYKKGETPNTVKAIYWFYHSEQESPVDILKTRDENGRSGEYVPGEYTICLLENDGYNVLKSVDITVEGEYVPPVQENTLTTDKDVYKVGDPVYVTATTNISGAWVSFFTGDDEPITDQSYWWYYVDGSDSGKTWKNGETYNIFEDAVCNNRNGIKSSSDLSAGDYRLVMLYSAGGNFTFVTDKWIKFETEDVPSVKNSISLNKEETFPDYKYGEEVLVSATSSNPAASVRLCDYKTDDE